MAVAGRKPKPDDQKRHSVRPTHDWVEVVNVPFEAAPALFEREWSADTMDWWADVSRMPHCVLWTASDWRFAQVTALVAEAVYDGKLQHMGELRNREKIMGVTADARRDLRIRYVDPPTKEERRGVTALDAYRQRVK